MLRGHTPGVYVERGGLGFAGSTIVILPALLSWGDATLWVETAGRQAKLVEYSAGIIMIITWFVAIWVTAREEESHWWNCFFKGVGVPGVLVAAGNLFAYSVE